jgi:multidrug resistance efflux pump
MKMLKKVLIALGILILIGGAAAAAYYFYESFNYFSTQNAQVTADMVTITPEITGKLKDWKVQEGDLVRNGQILGRQDVSSMASNTALSAQNLANTADLLAAKADIKAPVDGKIVESNVVAGQVLAPGMEIATIADIVHLYVKANIEETVIFRIQPGQQVDLTIDAYPGKKFQGYVESIGQITNSALSTSFSLTTSGTFSKVTQLIPVRISLLNPDNLPLMPGMNTTVKIHIN